MIQWFYRAKLSRCESKGLVGAAVVATRESTELGKLLMKHVHLLKMSKVTRAGLGFGLGLGLGDE